MVGAAVAAAGWRRRTALATATGIIAANIPDVDIVTAEAGELASLALRRGWTHGPPAVLLGALVTVGLVLLYDRVRRRRRPDAPPVRPRVLLLLALVAAVTHPLLDWMNTYGIRLLMPFDRSWYYGDSLFIIDPWLWLILGVPLFLIHSRSTPAIVAWTTLALATSALVVGTGFVPPSAKVVWLMGVATAAVLRFAWRGPRRPDAARVARVSVATAALYVGAMVVSSRLASVEVHAVAERNGISPQRVMVAPRPARPLHAEIVIEDATAYHFGTFHWLAEPRVSLQPERSLQRGSFDEVARAAARQRDARDFLVWSRFPIVETRHTADGGYIVRFGDARYVRGPGSGSLGGLTVQLDSALRVVGRAP